MTRRPLARRATASSSPLRASLARSDVYPAIAAAAAAATLEEPR